MSRFRLINERSILPEAVDTGGRRTVTGNNIDRMKVLLVSLAGDAGLICACLQRSM
jgi:hypothetical protein